MLLWIAMALMTGAAVMAVLWPLSRRVGGSEVESRCDVDFYRDQLAEIDRELDRGLLSEEQARAARAEAGRRLLKAHADGDPSVPSTGEPALRRRRAAAAFSLSVIPLIALAVYGVVGSPQAPSRAEIAAAATTNVVADLGGAIARIESHLAAHPEDGRGWEVIAPVYFRAGRYDDAAKAYAATRRLEGDNVERLTGHGEALVAAAGGVVSAEALAIFERALSLDHASAKARFYGALAAEQDGNTTRARADYERMIADAPPQAPWAPVVRTRLARLAGEQPPELIREAATPEIAAMVEGLDTRLARDGGSEPEWARLVRSFVVLGRQQDAQDRLVKAKTALAGDAQAVASLDKLAQDLGLGDRKGRR